MKNRNRRAVILAVVSAVWVSALTGCGQRLTQNETQKVTETETQKATEAKTEKATEAVTEAVTETEQKLITSVDYTSKDGSIKITLPDNTWKVTQDADEMRVFQSESTAIINIVHATGTALKNLSVMTSEENLDKSLTQQYTDTDAYEIKNFSSATVNNINTYHYLVKYNAKARMWAYSVTYAIVAQDQAYVITGTVTDDNETLLKAVQKSVDSFRVLNDDQLKVVTGELLSGTTQKVSETVKTNTASDEELTSLSDYGTSVQLVTVDTVNVRSKPGTDSDILITLNPQASVAVTGETSNWFRVNINGNVGYIRKDFLVYGTSTTTTSETTAAETQADTTSSAGSSNAESSTATNYGTPTTLYASSEANVRSAPGTDSSIINAVSSGAAVTVTGETDNWFIVSVGGATGYISKALLTTESSGGSTSSSSGDNGSSSTGGSTTTTTPSSPSAVSGTITGAGVDTITIAGDDGNTYTVYYGDASVNTESGIYDGVYVSIALNSAQASADGTLYATSVTGY